MSEPKITKHDILEKTPGMLQKQLYIIHTKPTNGLGPIPVIASGPLMDDRGEQMIGSVIIVDSEDRSVVDRHMANEPFNLAGLYESLTINRWYQRVGNIASQEPGEGVA